MLFKEQSQSSVSVCAFGVAIINILEVPNIFQFSL